MKCCWCNGSGKVGCHFCEHCNKGEATNPPYGPIRYLTSEDEILTKEQIESINWVPVHYLERIRFICNKIGEILGVEAKLSEEEVKRFQDYWFDNYRTENIGELKQRIAMYIKDKASKTFSV